MEVDGYEFCVSMVACSHLASAFTVMIIGSDGALVVVLCVCVCVCVCVGGGGGGGGGGGVSAMWCSYHH